MKKEIIYTVYFYRPGSFMAEVNSQIIKTPDPNNVIWPESAYCFTLAQHNAVTIDGETLTGKQKTIGKRYYHPDCKISTLEEVEKSPKGNEILLSNMKCNNWERIIWSRYGGWPQPFDEEEDVILPFGKTAHPTNPTTTA